MKSGRCRFSSSSHSLSKITPKGRQREGVLCVQWIRLGSFGRVLPTGCMDKDPLVIAVRSKRMKGWQAHRISIAASTWKFVCYYFSGDRTITTLHRFFFEFQIPLRRKRELSMLTFFFFLTWVSSSTMNILDDDEQPLLHRQNYYIAHILHASWVNQLSKAKRSQIQSSRCIHHAMPTWIYSDRFSEIPKPRIRHMSKISNVESTSR